MEITNTAMLQEAFQGVLIGATNYCLDKAKEALQECIDKQGIGDGGSFYVPSGEFREAWTIDDAVIQGIEAVGELRYDSSKMTFLPYLEDTYRHGTPNNDATEDLPRIIFMGTSGNALNLGVYQGIPRDAWSDFLDILDAELGTWFNEYMISHGLSGSISMSF